MSTCKGTIEYHTHTTWWAPCALADGHAGACRDRAWLRRQAEQKSELAITDSDDYLEHCSRFGGP